MRIFFKHERLVDSWSGFRQDGVHELSFDIDGMLTDENKRLDMHAVEALRRLEDAVYRSFLLQETYAITYGLWRFIGLSGPMCCENGGVLWHPD